MAALISSVEDDGSDTMSDKSAIRLDSPPVADDTCELMVCFFGGAEDVSERVCVCVSE